jgi:hypothetical protein
MPWKLLPKPWKLFSEALEAFAEASEAFAEASEAFAEVTEAFFCRSLGSILWKHFVGSWTHFCRPVDTFSDPSLLSNLPWQDIIYFVT